MNHHSSMEGLISRLETDAQNSGHPDTVKNSASNLYGKALNSVRESKLAHARGDYQTAVSMMHHAAEQASAAAKTHGGGSSIGSLKALASDYAGNVGR
jgi:hypothetical protein